MAFAAENARLQQERDQAKSAAEKASEELAKNRPGQNTELYQQAKRLFLDGKIDRAETLLRVALEQVRAVGLIEEGQPDLAIAALDDATRLLGDISMDSPVNDRLALGYIYKTYAQIFSVKGDEARAEDYRNKALAVFERVAHEVLPEGETAAQFADAIHGIGNIHQAREGYRQAI